jgi:dolichol-phosphate mannosyltransferase
MHYRPQLSEQAAAVVRSLPGPILILGAGGFVGANLFLALEQLRDDVIAAVHNLPSWRLEGIDADRILQADIADAEDTRKLLEDAKPKVVFDCITYGGYSFEKDVGRIVETNFTAKVRLLELLAEQNIAAYVHGGSSSEYGLNCTAPGEDAKLLPNSHYAVAKAALAQHITYMGKLRKVPCVNLRLYAVYGPLEDASRLMPALVGNGIEGKYPQFVDPDISRDFVYITDVCEAFVRAAADITPDRFGESFNIGTGRLTTMRQLAETAKAEFQIAADPQFGTMQNRHWDLAEWYADPIKARDKLGWSGQTMLADGLHQMAEWMRAGGRLLSQRDLQPNHERSISAIIACYKDAQAIPYMYQRLTAVFTKLNVDYEIIFVNDGSPDESTQVIEEISARDPHVIGIVHSRNFSSQMAFRSGMELSTKKAVVLLDGDLQDPPELIEQFYHKWVEGFDVVYGRRVKRDMPWHWGLLYKAFYRVFSRVSYIRIPTDAGDFSLIDKRVAGWLLRCPERDLFMRGLRAYAGFRQTGVDYLRPERMFGVSTNSLMKNIDWAKKGIFSFSNMPLTTLTNFGALILILSFLAAFVIGIIRIFFPDSAPPGFTTVILLVLAFGGMNLFAIGIVGEYIGKILIETKARPRFIRERIIRRGRSILQNSDGHSL